MVLEGLGIHPRGGRHRGRGRGRRGGPVVVYQQPYSVVAEEVPVGAQYVEEDEEGDEIEGLGAETPPPAAGPSRLLWFALGLGFAALARNRGWWK